MIAIILKSQQDADYDCNFSSQRRSEHPLAKAIVAQAEEQGIELETPESFTAYPGKWISGKFGNNLYFVGNRRLFVDQNIALSESTLSLLDDIEKWCQLIIWRWLYLS